MTLTHRLLVALAAVPVVIAGCGSSGSDTTARGDRSTISAPSTTDPSTTDPSTTESTPSPSSEPTSTVDTECSASGLERPGPQPDLPPAVQERREAILSAALACDLRALAALTGPSFTASFGGGAPEDVWSADEDLGHEPMRALVEILRLDPAPDEGDGDIAYLWPPAFAYDSWQEVPEADRQALRVLYDDADFEGFAQFGGYIGYRTRITEDGTWTAFVAGD